jgi:ring-1,2-phenylacetyl-CoA epoxidase subunit PaaE
VAKHFRSLTIKDIRKETVDCISVAFDIPPEWKEDFQFRAGQNITIRTPMLGEELRRSYSICSSPHENELRIAIKKAPGGKFSTYALESLKPGHMLEVMAPTGNFQLKLDEKNNKHYIAFAAGSGITPVISLIKSVLREEVQSRVSLIYGNRTRNDIIFREELESLKNTFTDRLQLIYIFSREKADASVYEGRIDAAKCELIFQYLVPLNTDAEYLLCGPSPMIFGVRDWLLQQKIATSKIHYELFANPGDPVFDPLEKSAVSQIINQRESHVTIRLDGVSHDFQLPYSGDSILDAAIKQGADLPYACKAGVCASCRAKLLEGEVIMDHNYALADEELDDGFILTCQSHARSARIVIDFDIR